MTGPKYPCETPQPEGEETREMLAALELSRMPGVGAAMFKRLIQDYGSPSRAYETYVLQSHSRAQRDKSPTVEGLVRAREYLSKQGVAFRFGGSAYPLLLCALSEPPPVLFVRGQTQALSMPFVAIVGARKADEEGLKAAQDVSKACVRLGLSVVSGGARGVDAAAHYAALAEGGWTVAVLGTGIDVVYPPEHQTLFQDIVQRGALVTELLPGAAPARGFFLTRNRIIAGLARVVVVICGRARSGALTTARWAQRLGRPVLTLAAPADDPLGEAAKVLGQRGATVLPDVTGIEHWLTNYMGK